MLLTEYLKKTNFKYSKVIHKNNYYGIHYDDILDKFTTFSIVGDRYGDGRFIRNIGNNKHNIYCPFYYKSKNKANKHCFLLNKWKGVCKIDLNLVKDYDWSNHNLYDK